MNDEIDDKTNKGGGVLPINAEPFADIPDAAGYINPMRPIRLSVQVPADAVEAFRRMALSAAMTAQAMREFKAAHQGEIQDVEWRDPGAV